jgi:Carboxypeptidase regulatory-like domain
MTIAGIIRDDSTGLAIPSATVQITDNSGSVLASAVASSGGKYNMQIPIGAYYIRFSSVGYYTAQTLIEDYLDNSWEGNVNLFRSVISLPPVIVTSHKNTSLLLLGAAGILLLASKKEKKKVGKITNANLLTVALGAGLLLSFGTIKKLLCKAGIWPGNCNAADTEVLDTDSPWTPDYYQKPGRLTAYEFLDMESQFAMFDNYCDTIHNAFTVFNDDFNAALGVFQQLHSKCKVSFLCYRFKKNYDVSLLSFLQDGGGILPWDGLSDTHMDTLINYVKNLPVK